MGLRLRRFCSKDVKRTVIIIIIIERRRHLVCITYIMGRKHLCSSALVNRCYDWLYVTPSACNLCQTSDTSVIYRCRSYPTDI